MSVAVAHEPGQGVGPYTLVRLVGQGGFSEVWAAQDALEPVALKLLIHPEHLAQLRAEASALSLVRGPGIVPILGMDLHGDPPWIALRLLEGGNLRQRMRARGRALSSRDAVDLLQAILDVLGRVHGEGIVHGDLKPENVLFDSRGTLHLADFGLSRRISQRSASLSVSLSLEDARLAGTLDYMAPEQRSGEKPTARSDVFAAGVIFYELLTRERPQGVFKMPSELDASLPPVVDRLIACSLAQDPRHRFASAAPMLAFLRAGVATDWQELAQAHGRLTRLAKLSTATQANSPRTLGCALLIGLGAISLIVLLLFASQGEALGLGSSTLLRLVLGVAVATLVGNAVARRCGPWLAARTGAIEELRRKTELQIRTGGTWAGATARTNAALRTRAPAAPALRAPGPFTAPPSFNGARLAPVLGVVLMAIFRAATTSSRPSTDWNAPPPFPVVHSPSTFEAFRIPEATERLRVWPPMVNVGATKGIASVGSLVYVSYEDGLVRRLEQDGETRWSPGETDLGPIAVSADRVAVVARRGERVLVSNPAGAPQASFDAAPGVVSAVALSEDGTECAVGTASGDVTVFATATGRALAARHVATGAVAALGVRSGHKLVVAAVDGTVSHLKLRPSLTRAGDMSLDAVRTDRASRSPLAAATLSSDEAWLGIAHDVASIEAYDAGTLSVAYRMSSRGTRSLAVSEYAEFILAATDAGELVLHRPRDTVHTTLPGFASVERVRFVQGARFVVALRSGALELHEIVR